jgi:hypothetical protein
LARRVNCLFLNQLYVNITHLFHIWNKFSNFFDDNLKFILVVVWEGLLILARLMHFFPFDFLRSKDSFW